MSKTSITDIDNKNDVLYKRSEYPDMSFMGGKYLFYLIKKGENFVRAVYLVTNFLSDNEPLKWRLRTSATELISGMMSFIQEDKNKTNDYLYRTRFIGGLSSLISFLNIAAEGGAISGANSSLLKAEITTFFPILSHKIFTLRTDTAIESFVSKKKKNLARRKQTRTTRTLSVINQNDYSESPLSPTQDTTHVLYKYKGQRNIPLSLRKKKPNKRLAIMTQEKMKRQKSLTDILKDNKQMNIKEIVSFMKGFGEKTIQRDIVDLVGKGVLKRHGKKRWSAYSFVQPLLI